LEVLVDRSEKLASTPHHNDTQLLASKIRQHRLLFNQLHLDTFASIDDESRLRMQDALIHLEAMYPINKDMYPTVWDLYSSFQGRGIVMAAGNAQFKYSYKFNCKDLHCMG
jgi:hypothetical protein